MTDQLQKPGTEQALLREMGFTAQNIERRKRIVGLATEDSKRIALLKDVVQKNVDELTSTFFSYLGGLEESKVLLGNRDLSEKARVLKSEHLADMVRGEYGSDYVEQRLRLALIYSKAGLDARVFLGAFHHLLRAIGVLVMKQFEQRPLEGFESFMSLKKVAFLDIAIIVDVLISERERVIR